MTNPSKANEGLLDEISSLKQRIQELEASEANRIRTEQELTILAEIGRKISATLNIDEVFERLAAESKKLIQYVRLQVALLNPREEKFTVLYTSGDALPKRDVGDSFPMAGSMSEAVLTKRAGIIIQGADKDELIRACSYLGVVSIRHMDILSLISVPLISNDNVIGVLHFRSNKPNAYSDQDLRLAEGIGREIAGAIINAQLYCSVAKAEEALRRSEIKYRTLFESAEDHIFILQPAGQGSHTILDANQAAIHRFGRTREDLIGRKVEKLIPPGWSRREDIAGQLSKPGDKVLFETRHIDKNQAVFPVEVSAQVVKIENDPPFILAIERDITERKRIETELNRSGKRAERLAQELAIINEIGRKISSTLDIDDVYDRLAVESSKLIDYDRILVTLLDSKKAAFRVVYTGGFDPKVTKVGDSLSISTSMAGIVFNKKSSLIFQAADINELRRLCLSQGLTSFKGVDILSRICIPLISNDQMIGSLHFGSKKPNAYNEQDLHLAEGIGQEIAGAITNAQLYTNLQKTEKSLREGRELFLRLIDAAPDGVVQTDIDGKILFANEVALRMGGYTDISELRGRNIFTFIAPEDRERLAEDLRLLPQQEPAPQIYQVIGDDGRTAAIEINANVLCDEKGSSYGNVLLFRDVTERSRMEEMLRTSEANYRFLTDNMNDMIWTVDLDLNTTYINKSVEKLLGYTPEERIGKDFSKKCTPESYDHIRRIIAEQSEIDKSGSGNPNRIISIEGEFYHKNGSTVWMESLVSVLRDKEGVLIGYHGVSRNISDRKKLEQELRKILDTLENRIQERTIELEEVNTALRVLLKKGEQDLKRQGRDIKDNVEQLVMPFLQKLKISSSIEQKEMYANIIEANLTQITSSFTNQLSESYKTLTPKEIQIAAMIRDGKSSKEIAEIMSVSTGTIVTHRNNIRKKLKLPSREINLRSHLLSLC